MYTYHDKLGRFISQGEYLLRSRRAAKARNQYRADGKWAKKPDRSWILWFALGAFGMTLLAIFL